MYPRGGWGLILRQVAHVATDGHTVQDTPSHRLESPGLPFSQTGRLDVPTMPHWVVTVLPFSSSFST